MRYELKKLFYSRIMFIGILISCMYGCYESYMGCIARYALHEKLELEEYLIDTYRGSYTTEKLNELEKLKEEAYAKRQEDYENEELRKIANVYASAYNSALYHNQVLEYRQGIVKNAKRLQSSSDDYKVKVNQKIEKLYAESPEIIVLPDRKCEDIVERLAWSEKVDLINILLMVVAAGMVFIIEHSRNTYPLVYSSYKGRGRTYFRKMGSLVLFAVFLSVVTTLSTLSMTFTYGGSENWWLDIQNVKDLSTSPYVWNLFQLTIVITVFRAIGYITLICIFGMISTCFKSYVLPLVINTMIGVGGTGLCIYYAANYFDSGYIMNRVKIYRIFLKFTPFGLFCDGMGYIEKFNPLVLFGMPVTMHTVCIMTNVGISLMILGIGYVLYIKRYRYSG